MSALEHLAEPVLQVPRPETVVVGTFTEAVREIPTGIPMGRFGSPDEDERVMAECDGDVVPARIVTRDGRAMIVLEDYLGPGRIVVRRRKT